MAADAASPFAGRGDSVTIDVRSLDFDTRVFLFDPEHNLVLQSPDMNGWSSFLHYSPRTNGAFYIDVTSEAAYQTGNFTLSFSCERSPELDVFLENGAVDEELVHGAVLDFGIITNGGSLAYTLILTNSGTTNLLISGMTSFPSNLFTLNPATVTNIPAGGFTNVTVTFNAISNGPQSGFVAIDHNDTEDDPEFDNPFVIYLEAFANPVGTPPTVSITSPASGLVLTVPSDPLIQATASANTGSVSKVEIRVTGPAGKSIIGSDTNSP